MTDTSTQDRIRAVEQADSPDSLILATRALAAAQDEAGISTLIAVLGYNNPTAAVVAVEGLIALGDKSVQPLIEQLDQYDYGARAYAIRALATIASPRALDLLTIAAETDFAPGVRRAALAGLGKLRWSQMDAEERQSAQAKALQTLLTVSQDLDWSIRYAAVVGLQGLSSLPHLHEQILFHIEQTVKTDIDAAVCARAQLFQSLLGIQTEPQIST